MYEDHRVSLNISLKVKVAIYLKSLYNLLTDWQSKTGTMKAYISVLSITSMVVLAGTNCDAEILKSNGTAGKILTNKRFKKLT
jgi:hypothetical protein